jgi:hypothetical protein
MQFCGDTLVPIFFNAFRHLECEATEKSDLRLSFFDGKNKKIQIEHLPWAASAADHLGLISTFTDESLFTLQQPGSNALYLLHQELNEGFYFIPDPENIPYWEGDFPLRMIFHWWLKQTSYQPVHAAAVGTNDGGVLLVGKGGSGKSTSALACVNSCLKIAGDDYVLLNCENKIVYSMFSLTKLNDRSLVLLRNLDVQPNQLSKAIEGKYRLQLFPSYKDSLIQKMPVVAILLPEVTDNKHTVIQPCSPGDAIRALAPTTLFQLPGLREEAFQKMAIFSRQTPAFRLKLGSDSPVSLPEMIQSFIRSIVYNTPQRV